MFINKCVGLNIWKEGKKNNNFLSYILSGHRAESRRSGGVWLTPILEKKTTTYIYKDQKF